MVDRVENSGAGGAGGEAAPGDDDTGHQAEREAPAKGAEAAPASRGNEPSGFSKAFQRAEKTLSGEDKPAPKADKPANKPAPKAEKPADKPAPKAEKPAKAEAGGGQAGAHDEANAGDGAGEGAEADAEQKAPLKPRRGWPRRAQEDFHYLTREEQEARLAAPLEAPSTWDEESKAAFAKLPVEAQDELIYRAKEIERGYQGKFEALAGERKMFEEMKAAVPERVRALMTARNLNEGQAFKALVGLQEFAMRDPIGYVADFIARGNIDVEQLADRLMATDTGGRRQQQAGQAQQQSIELHPAYVSLKQDRDRLHAQIEGQQQQIREAAEAEAKFVLEDVMTKRDEATGELRYPFARVLASHMADLYEGEREAFAGLSPQAAFDLAYRTALDASPELKRYASQKPAPKGDQGDGEPSDKRAERAREASTPKSKTPTSAPASKGTGSAFNKAFARAEKRLGAPR